MKRILFGMALFGVGLAGIVWLRRPADAQVEGARIVAGPTEPESRDQQAQLLAREAAFSAKPEDAMAIRLLGLEYAEVFYRGGESSAHVQAALAASKNVWLLSNTAYSLQNLYNQGLQMGTTKPGVAAYAEELFLRAKAMDPNLDRTKILPQIDLAKVARDREASEKDLAARFEQAARNVQRLAVDAFPEIPPAVAGVLRSRHCTVPQAPNHPKHNVVRGEFFERDQRGWAVLCSVDGVSTLLVFRDDRDERPVALATSEDKSYLQGGAGDTVEFSHGIGVADRDDIVRHAQPGEPKPQNAIDHHGIDDAFLGKGSTIWYFERGQWLQLPGSD